MKNNNILIVYATKAGTTEDCAKTIAQKLKGEVNLINLKETNKFDLNNYNVIVIGSPIYAGMINKKVKQFCQKYESGLMNKQVAMFTCGLSEPEEALASLRKDISPQLLEHTKIIKHCGCELRPERLGFFMRFIINKMTQGKDVKPHLDSKAIDEFSKEIGKEIK